MKISIIVPTLDDEPMIEGALQRLQAVRQAGHEVIVADGGSADGTTDIARTLADVVVAAPRGRAWEMNAGASHATGEVLLFLLVDSCLPENAAALIGGELATSGRGWGHFDVQVSGGGPLLWAMARLTNMRARLTGMATLEQAIFVRRDLFERVGRFPGISDMEDIAMCRDLSRHDSPLCLPDRVITSHRRWHSQGLWRSVVRIWGLRLP